MTCEIEIIVDLFARYHIHSFWMDFWRLSIFVFMALFVVSIFILFGFEGKGLWPKVSAISFLCAAAISLLGMAFESYQIRAVLRIDITRAIALYGLDAIDTADSHLGGIFSRLPRIAND